VSGKRGDWRYLTGVWDEFERQWQRANRYRAKAPDLRFRTRGSVMIGYGVQVFVPRDPVERARIVERVEALGYLD
jgi:hypothetical protein